MTKEKRKLSYWYKTPSVYQIFDKFGRPRGTAYTKRKADEVVKALNKDENGME